jgi:hypothetical protein
VAVEDIGMTFDMEELLDTYVALYRGKALYVPEASGHIRWFVRDDAGNWKKDSSQRARWYARLVCREASHRISRETGNDSLARSIATAATVTRLEQLARSDPRLIGELVPSPANRHNRTYARVRTYSLRSAQESLGRV